MDKRLDKHVSIAQAVAKLLHPHAEVIIHDLTSGKISHIFNAFSRRRVGDSSMTDIDSDISLDDDVSGPYRKVNYDRKQLRSVTAVLRDDTGTPYGLFCINYDVSVLAGLVDLAASFLDVTEIDEKPQALFASDFKESANTILDSFLRERQLSIAALSTQEIVELIGEMDKGGVFALRNSMNYVCELLSLSRATIYKYLRRVRASTE
jgi:predicted transcriptional regulator YheO